MSRSVRSVNPDTKIVEVASLMCLYRFHGLPVVDSDEEPVGIIAEGIHSIDLDKEMARYSEILGLKTEELMTPNPVTVDPQMHVLRAATVMVRHNFRANVTSGLKGL
jgi:CBS domain-containing protein